MTVKIAFFVSCNNLKSQLLACFVSVGLKYCTLTRVEFENQKTRLKVQLEYSRDHLQKLTNRVSKLRETIHKDEAEIIGLQKVMIKYLSLSISL